MDRFTRWSSSSQGLLVLAAVFAIGAVVDGALGHTASALFSAALAVAIVGRAWSRQSR
jgi:uncharacterized membrane protein YjjB (DUF3815 family)